MRKPFRRPRWVSIRTLISIWMPLAVLAVAIAMTLWVTNTSRGERFAENESVGHLIFVLWVVGVVPLLVRLGRPAERTRIASEATTLAHEEGPPTTDVSPPSGSDARVLLVKVVWTFAVGATAFLVAGLIFVDPACWECITPGKVVGSVAAFATTIGLGLWIVWRRQA